MTKMDQKNLLKGVPYAEAQLKALTVAQLWKLAAALGAQKSEDNKYGTKNRTIELILEAQKGNDERVDNFCEMCGHYVSLRQDAHIAAEGGNSRLNILRLCPMCHLMLDTRLKPRLFKALEKVGAKNLPHSWRVSIYLQPSEKAKRKKSR